MLDFQQKRKVRSVMYHRVTLGVLSILVLVVLHSTWVVLKKERESENMKDISLTHVSELRQRSGDLQSKIDKLATVSGVEKEIRSKFSVAKDGENMVIVIPNNDSLQLATSSPVSLWQKIWSFFTK